MFVRILACAAFDESVNIDFAVLIVGSEYGCCAQFSDALSFLRLNLNASSLEAEVVAFRPFGACASSCVV